MAVVVVVVGAARRRPHHPAAREVAAVAVAVAVVDGAAAAPRRRVIEPAIAKRMLRADDYLRGPCHPLMARQRSEVRQPITEVVSTE